MTQQQMRETPAEDCGCDRHARKLISLEDAIARGLALVDPVEESESLPLDQAIGRVLAGDGVAALPMPPFDNSAMDGYLLRVADLQGEGPWEMRVIGRIAAGDKGVAEPETGSVLRILTGAPVPAGFDAVIMQEDVTRDGDIIRFDRRPRLGQHLRRQGEDAKQGEAIVQYGVEIGPRQAGALAAVGASKVSVYRRLRVAIFSTGSELRQPGEKLAPGQIWNSNRYSLLASLQKPWIEVIDMGAISDKPDLLRAALITACETADIVITTGGVSVGDEDHMPRLFQEAGGEMDVMKVAIKPGKPIAFGRLKNAVYVGLPGNPVSAFVTWLVIGERILERRAGLKKPASNRILVRASKAYSRRPGRCEFRPARYSAQGKGAEGQVELLAPSFSARIALLSGADGLAVIPADSDHVEKGDVLEFIPF